MDETRRKKPAIGLMTGSFHTDYSWKLARAVYTALGDRANLFLMQGFDSARFLELGAHIDNDFDLHYYSVFEYAKFLKLDALMISFGTISAITDALPLEEFLAALPKVPIVLLEDEVYREDCTFVTVENYHGMRDCMEHLIRDHGYREILFVSGPRDVHDAGLRRKAYDNAMEAHGLPHGEDRIAYGNFTDQVDDVIRELLDRHPHPEAVVCANDEMAESAYRVLRSRGLVPGRDVAVTGFDDNESAAHMDPPLTSVRQDYRELAEAGVRLALEMLEGRPVEPVILRAHLVRRESCGCSVKDEKEVDGGLLEERREKKHLIHEGMISSLFLRTLIRENVTYHSFYQALGEGLHLMGFRRSKVLLLPPIQVQGRRRMFLTDTLLMRMEQEGETTLLHPLKENLHVRAFDRETALPAFPGEHGPTLIMPLFYENTHNGMFMAQMKDFDRLRGFIVALQIGTGIRFLNLTMRQREMQEALEEKNHILDYSATHDALTGLFNRAGILNEIYGFVRQSPKEDRYVAVMADLDHLKQINDTFGHSGGDTAICRAAELLGRALPVGSPLGRGGGDEFVAIFRETEENTAEAFRQRLKELCRECDRESRLPFYIGISTGYCSFTGREVNALAEFLKEADKNLYADKRHRRPTVVKEPE